MNTESGSSQNSSILIVDDEPDLCLVLEDLLRHVGYTVRSVMTGTEALHEAKQSSYGAVILDLGLPDLSGHVVLRRLEEMDPLLPVIVLTASIQESHTVEALRQGAFAYLTKPYNGDELQIILRRALDVRKLMLKIGRVEQVLNSRDAQLRQVVHTAQDGIVLADGDGKIILWNSMAERLFGYAEGEILGQPLARIMPAGYRESHQRGFERVKATGVTPLAGKTIEVHGLRKDGSEFPIELSISTWKSGGQMVSCGIIRDITLRKRTDAKLQQQQIEQQVLLDLIPAMVWYKDSQNRILRANRRAAESINKTVAEVEGRSTYDLYPEEAEQYHQDDLAVITSGQPKLGIVELYEIAPGHKRWVQTDKVPYRDAQGNVIGVLVFAQDITEHRQADVALRESEQQYRLLMEEASDGIAVLDADGYFRMANSKICAMFGYTKEELLQLHVKDTYIPGERDHVQQRLDQLHASKPLRFIHVGQRKDRTVMSIEVSVSKMSDDRCLIIVRDLTQ
ncbi:MAG TPA: PAS domain S-box protein, partial [Nitrospiraceae bacterium]